MSTREKFLRARVREVTVGDVAFHVRPLTGSQLERLLAAGGLDNKPEGSVEQVRALATVCAYCLCEPSGERVFRDEEIDAVADAGLDVLRPVSEAALEASGLGDDDLGEA